MLKKLLLMITLFLCIPLTQIHAGSDVYIEDTLGVLSSEEKQELQTKAQELSDQYAYGIYAYIIYDETGVSYDDMDSYIETYYSDKDLGYGDTHNGVLLLITQTDQGGTYQVYVPSNADQSVFSLTGLEDLDSAAYSGLQDHDYYNACLSYLDQAEYLFAYYETNEDSYGDNYTYEDPHYKQDNTKLYAAFTFGIPPVIALIIVLIMKSKNRTKAIALEAHDYIPDNGVNITNMRDFFLYRTTHRTPIHHDEGHHGGGGGGAHFSSSGGMHSSGGHF